MADKLFEIIEKTDDSITLAFKTENLTIVGPIKDALDSDPAVELVRFIETHPELDARKLSVKVREGDPAEAVVRASKKVEDYFSEINMTRSPGATASSTTASAKRDNIPVGDE